ncbi:MAG: glycosyltransferase family 2 protein [Bacteroidota bacterium]
MIENPKVSIILVSYNRLEVLRNTLAGIVQYLAMPTTEILLVDNASVEPVTDTIQREFPQVRVFSNKINIGFGGGNNIGAQKAQGEFLLFVNSDLVLRGNPLPAMVEMFNKDSHAGIVGCQLLNRDGSLQPSYFRFPNLTMRFLQLTGLKTLLLKILPWLRFNQYQNNRLDFVSGAFFMIKRSLFFDVRCFDDRYFMYLEDADLGYQVARRGKYSRLLHTRDVIHLGAHYEEIDNPFVLHNMNRGHLLFYKKNYSSWKFIVLVLMSIGIYSFYVLFSGLRYDGRMVRKHYSELIRLYYNALVDDHWFDHADPKTSIT